MNVQPDGIQNIRSELEELKRLNKLDSFRGMSFPSLAALGERLADRTLGQSAAVELTVTPAIDRLPVGPHRDAASELIGFGANRSVARSNDDGSPRAPGTRHDVSPSHRNRTAG